MAAFTQPDDISSLYHRYALPTQHAEPHLLASQYQAFPFTTSPMPSVDNTIPYAEPLLTAFPYHADNPPSLNHQYSSYNPNIATVPSNAGISPPPAATVPSSASVPPYVYQLPLPSFTTSSPPYADNASVQYSSCNPIANVPFTAGISPPPAATVPSSAFVPPQHAEPHRLPLQYPANINNGGYFPFTTFPMPSVDSPPPPRQYPAATVAIAYAEPQLLNNLSTTTNENNMTQGSSGHCCGSHCCRRRGYKFDPNAQPCKLPLPWLLFDWEIFLIGDRELDQHLEKRSRQPMPEKLPRRRTLLLSLSIKSIAIIDPDKFVIPKHMFAESDDTPAFLKTVDEK